MKRIVVFASGRGTGFDSIQRAVASGTLKTQITSVVCDQPGAGVLSKAKAANIATHLVQTDVALEPVGVRRRAHEDAIIRSIELEKPDWIVLAGYMRIFTPHFIKAFASGKGYSRIVNVHPSLLPSFSGVDGYAQAFQYGCKITGVSVHLVDDSLDGGPLLAQEAFSIDGCKSVDEVERRGLEIEHRLYPETLEWVLAEEFELSERRVCVRKN